jgi:hypothetical protein
LLTDSVRHIRRLKTHTAGEAGPESPAHKCYLDIFTARPSPTLYFLILQATLCYVETGTELGLVDYDECWAGIQRVVNRFPVKEDAAFHFFCLSLSSGLISKACFLK